ncbi:MAG: rhodanese-like domain-containing protein [Pseudomonadales bacterium]
MSVRLLEPEELAAERNPDWLIVQVVSADRFAAAHLPGAVLVEPAELVAGVAPATGKLPDIRRLQSLFERIGYKPGRFVVALDDEGGGWAGRLLWTLDCIGERQWGYLNGGIVAWAEAGLPLSGHAVSATGSTTEPEPPGPSGPLSLRIDPEPIAELADVRHALDDSDTQIWDVRSAEEYAGTRSASARAGHIPGAINLDWMALKDAGRGLRLIENLPQLLSDHGIDGQQKRVITHCQTHHRSGLSYLVGRLLGFKQIQAYHGSWSEWGNDPDTPIVNPSAGERDE